MSKKTKPEIKGTILNDKAVEVSISMSIGGVLYGRKKRYYTRGRVTCCTDLEQLAQIISIYERLYEMPGTYADFFLSELKDKINNRNGLTVDQLIKKYWTNHKKTLEEQFEKRNKADAEGNWWGPLQNDYLKETTAIWLNNFSMLPYPQQLAIIQGIIHLCGGKDELIKEIDACPEWEKELVKQMFEENNAHQQQKKNV